MEDILIIVLQAMVEILCQILGSDLLDLFWWHSDDEAPPPVQGLTRLGFFIVGGVLGLLSLWLMPHTLLHWGWLRMANLVIGPLGSGWTSWRFARWRARHDPGVVPWHHAVNAALACLGMVLVRFIWCAR